MKTKQITLAAFVAKHQITMSAVRTAKNPNMDSETPMDHWLCTIAFEGRHFPVHFSTGTGLRKKRENARPIPDFEVYDRMPRNRAQSRNLNRAAWENEKAAQFEPVAPSVEGVLSCLSLDASGFENARSFDDWCSEYSYDTDSRKAFKTFRVIEQQAAQLKAFLGSEIYSQLLWNTEPL